MVINPIKQEIGVFIKYLYREGLHIESYKNKWNELYPLTEEEALNLVDTFWIKTH